MHILAILWWSCDAIADSVGVITVSQGPKIIEMDSIATGASKAKWSWNIINVVAVGNSGNLLGRVTNVAPWIVLVAARLTN